MRVAQADGAHQDGDDVRQEGRARVEEHADDDRQHGVGQNVDVEQVLGHHDGRHDGIEHHQREQQRQAALAVVVVLAEQVEVEHEAQHEDADVEYLPEEHQPLLSHRVAALDGLLAQALQDVVGLGADNLAAVDDLLPAQYDAAGPRIVFQHLLAGSLGAQAVVGQVGGQVVVQGTLAQDVGTVAQGVGRQDVVVGRLDGEQLVRALLPGRLVAYGHDALGTVTEQRFHVFGREDARLVHFLQFFFDVLQVIGVQARHEGVVLVVGPQLLQGFFLHGLVLLVVGLEAGQDAVLLVFHHFVRLVDGEVERGHQLAVFPGLVDVKLIVKLPVTRQEVDHNQDTADENEGFV